MVENPTDPPEDKGQSETVPRSETQLSGPPTVLDLEPVFVALSKSRRRYLVYALQATPEWSLSELATKIAAWENDIPASTVHEDERKRVYVSLFHTHIPKLVDHNVIRFDEESETIAPAQYTDQVVAALDGVGASLDAAQETHARGEIDDQHK